MSSINADHIPRASRSKGFRTLDIGDSIHLGLLRVAPMPTPHETGWYLIPKDAGDSIPSIEGTAQSQLRGLWPAAHVKRLDGIDHLRSK
jgi:hypothetical protein